ncbi:major facilitator superfamily domain-containing protein [Colletotrichum godetiae]|uniref:Major facilitator superfamily domain-containing protein n=1 Tax=Colletotrichum godetiae TaxID=1209918 RepID=A0AAJ0AYI3_9PEZI|nr:major facilitator superfamily domain-containing protein [Colletotrichum godetiae]KAK1691366.1 major facilitator superfamily domain-containing protein [Colletotrichum godetiae]
MENGVDSGMRALPPGTVHLLHTDSHGAGADEVILVPQPSKHPDNPLNWSKSRKTIHICLIYLYTFTCGYGGTATYSVLTDISRDTNITLTQLNLGTGLIFLLAGWGNCFWQPLALTFGRRPVFLASLLGCLIISEWTAWTDSFAAWTAGRILIPDTFFAHERGAYVGIYSMVLQGSNFFAPFVSGFINDALGWQWVQHVCAIFFALNLILALFFQEESMFERQTAEVDVDPPSNEEPRHSDTARVGNSPVIQTTVDTREPADDEKATSTGIANNRDESMGETYTVKSYRQKQALYTRSGLTFKQCLRIAYRPIFIFFQFPCIAWAGLQYGFTNAWYSVYNATASSILSSQPYSYRASMVGVTYLAPLLGALIGGYVSGPVSDSFSMRLARRNKGFREPEHRLWGMSLTAIILPLGLLLWGVGAAFSLPIGVLMLGSVFCGFGIVTGGTYSITYSVDAFKEIAGESIVSLILCRNTLTFGFSYAITPWIDGAGLQKTFIVVAIISFLTGVSFLIIIWKGKQLRIFSEARYWRYAAMQVVKH